MNVRKERLDRSMATADERMKILAMVREGKISPEQGVQLLEVLDTKEARAKASFALRPDMSNNSAASGRSNIRWFRIQVTDTNTGKSRVNMRLPASLVSAGAKMGARFAPQVEGLDSEKLLAYINSGETGKIVDVYNEADGEHVEVFIE